MGIFDAIKFSSKAFKSFDTEMMKEFKNFDDNKLLEIVGMRIGREADSPKFVDYEDSRLAMHILNRDRGYQYNDIKEAIRRGYF